MQHVTTIERYPRQTTINPARVDFPRQFIEE